MISAAYLRREQDCFEHVPAIMRVFVTTTGGEPMRRLRWIARGRGEYRSFMRCTDNEFPVDINQRVKWSKDECDAGTDFTVAARAIYQCFSRRNSAHDWYQPERTAVSQRRGAALRR